MQDGISSMKPLSELQCKKNTIGIENTMTEPEQGVAFCAKLVPDNL